MANGEISTSLPQIKKYGLELLQASYSSTEEASKKIPETLTSFYRQGHPESTASAQEVSRAANSLVAIYKRNVFPDLKVTWGTYPNNLGHMDFPGCFRCHDGSHTAQDGQTIAQDCDRCHQILATEESSPEILKTLGIADRISKRQ